VVMRQCVDPHLIRTIIQILLIVRFIRVFSGALHKPFTGLYKTMVDLRPLGIDLQVN
jgi:hypothetical protein